MVEDFRYVSRQGTELKLIKKVMGILVFINANQCVLSLHGVENQKALKEWLEKATKPRYYVKYDPIGYIVFDGKNEHSVAVANFGECEHFDAKSEAKKLCKRLNKQSGKG